MAARIGDLGQSRRLTSTLLGTQNRMRADEQAVASGKGTSSYARIADATGLLLRAKDTRQLKTTFIEHNERLTLRLQTTDAALGDLIGLAERARGLMVQRLNGAVGDSVPLDAEAATMLASVAAKLNATYDGSYIFAGSRTATPPVVLPPIPATSADPSLWYAGDTLRPSARIDTGMEIEHGILASEPPFAELIAALGAAGEAHVADDRAALQAAMDQLSGALDGLIDLRGNLGVKTSRLESVSEAQRASVAYLDETISGIEDTDLPEVISRLARDQASLEAAYLVTGRLTSLSLGDYLR